MPEKAPQSILLCIMVDVIFILFLCVGINFFTSVSHFS